VGDRGLRVRRHGRWRLLRPVEAEGIAVPYPNPNALRFPSVETYSAATTAGITVVAALASRRWSAVLTAQPPLFTATLAPRRWTAVLAIQP
jgi:hypothetical protein